MQIGFYVVHKHIEGGDETGKLSLY